MPLEYRKFRARTTIKTFRDLDVYKNTTLLCAEIFGLKLPEKYRKKEKLQSELGILCDLAKRAPLFIAEGHSRKFGNLLSGQNKLEQTAELINMIISKIDFLGVVVDDLEFKTALMELIKKYQVNKRRILNLKRAWGNRFVDSKWKKPNEK